MTAKPQACALTPPQERLWSETRTALLWQCPAFSHLFYSMLDNAGSKHIAMFTKDVPIAATDGSNLMLNPDTFFKYNLMERVFVCAHEIAHCMFNHVGTSHGLRMRGKVAYPDGKELPYDDETMNIAEDLVINDLLIESKVGTFNKDWLHDTKIATGKDSAIDAYRKVYKQTNGGKNCGTMSGKRFDVHAPPGTSQGKDPVTASQQRNNAEWQTAIAAAANSAKVQGKLPAGLERVFNELLEPKVNWQEQIQAMFARKVGSGSFDWRRPDRRLICRDIYAPGRSGFGAGTVVVAIDTSGSIGAKELDMFMAEMAGILEDVRPKRMLIAWCDAAVHRVDEADDPQDLNHIRSKGAPGGGGTSFIPVFDMFGDEREIDALVYLTDGLGSFPAAAPPFTVIWGSIYSKPDHYPFGDVVEIPRQAT